MTRLICNKSDFSEKISTFILDDHRDNNNTFTKGAIMKLKRFIFIALCTVLVSGCVIPLAAEGVSAKPLNWYCRHVKDGRQPECDSEMRFIEKYGGYYMDTKNCDPAAAEKVIYLTFDVGYENGNTAKILDTLKAEDVPGAFFVLENLVKREPALVQRMAAEGHLVCNHTASHKDMTKIHSGEAFCAELQRLEDACISIGVTPAKYYRPPEGRFSEENLKFAMDAGFKTVFWSFGYVDWDNERQMAPEEALAKILSGVHNGEVLLLHPTSATNAAILPDLIRELRARGYRFGTLDELTDNT